VLPQILQFCSACGLGFFLHAIVCQFDIQNQISSPFDVAQLRIDQIQQAACVKCSMRRGLRIITAKMAQLAWRENGCESFQDKSFLEFF
jgi:hypothetical protein